MGKREDFLFVVQTALIVNTVRLATDGDRDPGAVANFSTTHALSQLQTALDVADRIPIDMTAYEAGNEFCSYFFSNLRDQEPEGNKPQLPHWCGRF
ncbi:hypothetical protein OEG84_19610 [Hoeflea sp. G2-23]|uniref:Uncharacterized protein n=1 Tax=Hoeflea algicola TaxID=2983763 RepID=A0ABT3ZDI4_9HYPH|nr:hypothetical protein [Hoeflea algicola]MCY0149845.1 hypothetical protein [Hoeflea algicola]